MSEGSSLVAEGIQVKSPDSFSGLCLAFDLHAKLARQVRCFEEPLNDSMYSFILVL